MDVYNEGNLLSQDSFPNYGLGGGGYVGYYNMDFRLNLFIDMVTYMFFIDMEATQLGFGGVMDAVGRLAQTGETLRRDH